METISNAGEPVVEQLQAARLERGGLLALAIEPTVGLAVALPGGWACSAQADAPAEIISRLEDVFRPRWVVWGTEPVALAVAGIRLQKSWNIAAVHRLLEGGWRADPDRVWATMHGLDVDTLPAVAAIDLFTDLAEAGPPDEPIRGDGYLKPEWLEPSFEWTTQRLSRWAQLAAELAVLQEARLADLVDRSRVRSTARSESAAELLCAELFVDGLPVDRLEAKRIIASFVGPRPRTESEAIERRHVRDAAVLQHAPNTSYDLRNPAQVKSLLRGIGVELPTHGRGAWRPFRGSHPLIDALLEWRKAERIATTFGYGWLDEHLGADGRCRGTWSGSDGAAGRMTASAGLHNMPANLRCAVVAEPGYVFVRADLGQIEPRVLAAVSGDAALASATAEKDLYLPVATQLGVDRATAKVAVLGAMYGQTTGHGATALRGLESAFPVAMRYLTEADLAGQVGHNVRTYGGRLIRTAFQSGEETAERDGRSRAAAQGRYTRNAMVQGAAAELFKVWAVMVRLRATELGTRIVLCLHDELLVHAPLDCSAAVADLVADCLAESAIQWAPNDSVRFIAEVSTIHRWSDAKP